MSYFIQGVSEVGEDVYLNDYTSDKVYIGPNKDNKVIFETLEEAYIVRDSLNTFDIANIDFVIFEV